MKKIFAAVLILCMLPVFAAADADKDIEVMQRLISRFAEAYGGHDIPWTKFADTGNGYHQSFVDSGVIFGFRVDGEEITTVFVRGGNKENIYDFLSLCMAVSFSLMREINDNVASYLIKHYFSFTENDDNIPLVLDGYLGGFSLQDDGLLFLLTKDR